MSQVGAPLSRSSTSPTRAPPRLGAGGVEASNVEVIDGLAYLTGRDPALGWGLHILDVSNSEAPTPLVGGFYPSEAWDVEVVDGLAYIAGWDPALQIIDVSNPSAPAQVGTWGSGGEAYD